jgi:hypothetical protein
MFLNSKKKISLKDQENSICRIQGDRRGRHLMVVGCTLPVPIVLKKRTPSADDYFHHLYSVYRGSLKPGKTTDILQVTDKLHYTMLYRVHLSCAGLELTTLVVMGTGYISNCKSNYHTIMTTTTLVFHLMWLHSCRLGSA